MSKNYSFLCTVILLLYLANATYGGGKSATIRSSNRLEFHKLSRSSSDAGVQCQNQSSPTNLDEFSINIDKRIKKSTKLILKAINSLMIEQIRPQNCAELQQQYGVKLTGIFKIYPYTHSSKRSVSTYCDQDTEGGGWTLIQRRDQDLEPREDFFRSWIEYRLGFGSPKGEFWLGLENIHAITESALMELRIDLEDHEGNKKWAKYGVFSVGGLDSVYQLSVGRYSGTAGDGLSLNHTGQPFSTFDNDHDSFIRGNCAELFKGGWWYNECHTSNLNGYQYPGRHESLADGINWYPWRGYHYSLKRTTMMVRPAYRLT